MALYRLFKIDSAGYVVDIYEPECASDEEAYVKADALAGQAAIDIWHDDRWVGWLDGKDPHAIEMAHRVVV